MDSPVMTIINPLKQMLDMEPDDLLQEVAPFSSLVDDLRNQSWRLSPLKLNSSSVFFA
jgi:hypothetical protein